MPTLYCSTICAAEESTKLYVRQSQKGFSLSKSAHRHSLWRAAAASGCLHLALSGAPTPRPRWGTPLYSLQEPVEASGPPSNFQI